MISRLFTKKNRYVAAFALACGIFFTACNTNVGSVPLGDTVAWAVTSDGKYVRYMTNETANAGYLKYNTLSTPASSTNGITMNVMRKSGNAANGIGMVFFCQDDGNFCFALVSADGRYCVKRYADSKLVTVLDWTDSSAVRTGYGVVNTLSVQYEAWGRYGFYINGIKLGTMNVAAPLVGGKYGPAVAVGYPERENFPDVPVDAYFKVTSPNEYPVSASMAYRAAANPAAETTDARSLELGTR